MSTPLAPGLTLPRILVAGSRYWNARNPVYQVLDQVRIELGLFILVEGGCPGGLDKIAREWALATRTPLESHPARWDDCAPDCPATPRHRLPRFPNNRFHPGTLDTYCPAAGPRRNARMVSLGALRMFAWRIGRSTGTRNCMALAKAAGIPVTVHHAPVGRPA